jgi:hypothetical protein
MLPFNNPMVVRTDNGDLVDRGSHSLELILFRSLRQRILMVALDVALIKIPVGLLKVEATYLSSIAVLGFACFAKAGLRAKQSLASHSQFSA